MTLPSAHDNEPHFITRSGWLRAAVLGANDGIVSISSLLVGVASADPSPRAVLIAGVAGLTAGAMSMAAGEYVSVSSQSDIERADIARERQALSDEPEMEHAELVAIYRHRGLSAETAKMVADELTRHDALGSHVRDELGLSEIHAANPLSGSFSLGRDIFDCRWRASRRRGAITGQPDRTHRSDSHNSSSWWSGSLRRQERRRSGRSLARSRRRLGCRRDACHRRNRQAVRCERLTPRIAHSLWVRYFASLAPPLSPLSVPIRH